MIKIIMDSGKEYETEKYYTEDIINKCHEETNLGQGMSFERVVSKFIEISDNTKNKITINTSHISSIEEYKKDIINEAKNMIMDQ